MLLTISKHSHTKELETVADFWCPLCRRLFEKQIYIIIFKLDKYNIHTEVNHQFNLLKSALIPKEISTKEESKLYQFVKALYNEALNNQNNKLAKEQLYNWLLTHTKSPKNQIFNYLENLSSDALAFIQERREH